MNKRYGIVGTRPSSGLWEELYETGYFDAVGSDELRHITISNRRFFLYKKRRKEKEIPI